MVPILPLHQGCFAIQATVSAPSLMFAPAAADERQVLALGIETSAHVLRHGRAARGRKVDPLSLKAHAAVRRARGARPETGPCLSANKCPLPGGRRRSWRSARFAGFRTLGNRFGQLPDPRDGAASTRPGPACRRDSYPRRGGIVSAVRPTADRVFPRRRRSSLPVLAAKERGRDRRRTAALADRAVPRPEQASRNACSGFSATGSALGVAQLPALASASRANHNILPRRVGDS